MVYRGGTINFDEHSHTANLPMTMKLQRTKGRGVAPYEFSVSRELTERDVVRAETEPRDSTPPSLQRLSERHHKAARLLAGGESPSAVAFATGYTRENITLLQTDAMFKELVNSYRRDIEREFLDTAEELAGLSLDATQTLRDRLEADPNNFTNKELIQLGQFAADRSGHGPASSKEINVNVGLADRLASAKERVKQRLIEEARGGPVIEGELAT